MIVKTESDMKFVRENFNQIQAKLKNKNSDAESHFEKLLMKSGLFYMREKGNYKYDTRWCYYDYFIPRFRLYVEIDGIEHNGKLQKLIDKDKESIIKRKHFFIVHLTNDEVLSLTDIDRYYLLNKLFLYIQKSQHFKKKQSISDIRNNYWETVKYSRSKSEFDMTNELNNSHIDFSSGNKIHIYNHENGEFYEFPNIIKAVHWTGLSASYIDGLCNMEYKKSRTRKYVGGYTLNQCELNCLEVYT